MTHFKNLESSAGKTAGTSARSLNVVEREANDAAGGGHELAGHGVGGAGGDLVGVSLELDLEGARLAAHGGGDRLVCRGRQDAAAQSDGLACAGGAQGRCLYSRMKKCKQSYELHGGFFIL